MPEYDVCRNCACTWRTRTRAPQAIHREGEAGDKIGVIYSTITITLEESGWKGVPCRMARSKPHYRLFSGRWLIMNTTSLSEHRMQAKTLSTIVQWWSSEGSNAVGIVSSNFFILSCTVLQFALIFLSVRRSVIWHMLLLILHEMLSGDLKLLYLTYRYAGK